MCYLGRFTSVSVYLIYLLVSCASSLYGKLLADSSFSANIITQTQNGICLLT